MEVGLQPPAKYNGKQGEKLLPSFLSGRDGPEKSTETRQRWKHIRRLPYYGMLAEKKTRSLPYICCIYSRCRLVFLCSFISALCLYFLQVHPYLEWSYVNFFPLWQRTKGIAPGPLSLLLSEVPNMSCVGSCANWFVTYEAIRWKAHTYTNNSHCVYTNPPTWYE